MIRLEPKLLTEDTYRLHYLQVHAYELGGYWYTSRGLERYRTRPDALAGAARQCCELFNPLYSLCINASLGKTVLEWQGDHGGVTPEELVPWFEKDRSVFPLAFQRLLQEPTPWLDALDAHAANPGHALYLPMLLPSLTVVYEYGSELVVDVAYDAVPTAHGQDRRTTPIYEAAVRDDGGRPSTLGRFETWLREGVSPRDVLRVPAPSRYLPDDRLRVHFLVM